MAQKSEYKNYGCNLGWFVGYESHFIKPQKKYGGLTLKFFETSSTAELVNAIRHATKIVAIVETIFIEVIFLNLEINTKINKKLIIIITRKVLKLSVLPSGILGSWQFLKTAHCSVMGQCVDSKLERTLSRILLAVYWEKGFRHQWELNRAWALTRL